jgi:hypothetical protein
LPDARSPQSLTGSGQNRRLERLILRGDDGACTAEGLRCCPWSDAGVEGATTTTTKDAAMSDDNVEGAKTTTRAAAMSDADVDFLRRVAAECGCASPPPQQQQQGEKKRKKRKRDKKKRCRQCDVGCSDHFHAPTQSGDPPVSDKPNKKKKMKKKKAGGDGADSPLLLPLPCGRCVPGETVCVADYAAVPAVDRWNSLDGARTWIRLSPGLLEAHIRALIRPPPPPPVP